MRFAEINFVLPEPGPRDASPNRLLAYVSAVFEGEIGRVAVHDLKVIDGPHGPFVAMPSRRVAAKCVSCRGKNCLTASYCNWCGIQNPAASPPPEARVRIHADIVHPIDAETREGVSAAILEAYRQRKSRQE